MALKMNQNVCCVHMHICVSYICICEIHVYAYCLYLHIGNQTCSAYALFICTPKVTHICLYAIFRKPASTHLQRVAVSGRLHSSHLPWRWAISGKGAEENLEASHSPGEVSKRRLLRHFSTTDTGNFNHSLFRRNSQQRPPSPQEPPALSS